MTGCLPRLQKHQHHLQSEQREQLHRELRLLFGRARRSFLIGLLHYDGNGDDNDEERWQQMKLRDLEVEVQQVLGEHGSSSSSEVGIRLQCAAAYMLRAHKRAGYGGTATSTATGDGYSEDESSADEGSADNSADEDEGDYEEGSGSARPGGSRVGGAQQSRVGGYGGSAGIGSGRGGDRGISEKDRREMELKRNIALCFQWVVAKELAELGERYKSMGARAAPSC